MNLATKNSHLLGTLAPPTLTTPLTPEQVAGLFLQDSFKQPVKESVCLILEKGPAVLDDYF